MNRAVLVLLSAALLAARTARDEPPAERRPAPASSDAGTPDPDQEIVEHLDELQNLELLENFELFDPARDEEK